MCTKLYEEVGVSVTMVAGCDKYLRFYQIRSNTEIELTCKNIVERWEFLVLIPKCTCYVK